MPAATGRPASREDPGPGRQELYRSRTGGLLEGQGVVHARGPAQVRAPSVGLQHKLQRPGEAGEVAVVHPSVVQLVGELAEQPGPVPSGRFEGDADLHSPFHHLDRGPVRGRGSGLLPGTVPACGRTPLGDRSSDPRRDRSAAPTAGRRRGPSRATVRLGTGRLREIPLGWRPLGLLTPLSLAFTRSSPVAGASVCHASEGVTGVSGNSSPRIGEPGVHEV